MISTSPCHFKGAWTYHDVPGAFARALSELVERITIATHALSSSTGVACHLSSEQAARVAAWEYLERNLARLSYSERRPVVAIASPFASLERHGLKSSTYCVAKVAAGHCAVCLIDGRTSLHRPFEISVGHGFHAEIEEAARHAGIEALRTCASLMFGDQQTSLVRPVGLALPPGELWTDSAKKILASDPVVAQDVRAHIEKRSTAGTTVFAALNWPAPQSQMQSSLLQIPSQLNADFLFVARAERA